MEGMNLQNEHCVTYLTFTAINVKFENYCIESLQVYLLPHPHSAQGQFFFFYSFFTVSGGEGESRDNMGGFPIS